MIICSGKASCIGKGSQSQFFLAAMGQQQNLIKSSELTEIVVRVTNIIMGVIEIVARVTNIVMRVTNIVVRVTNIIG